MNITTSTRWKKMDKTVIPTFFEIGEGALVLYLNGNLESIQGHVRFFLPGKEGMAYEWTAGSSDDVTDIVDCWFKKVIT